jgi:hypothetical protein
MAVTLDDVKAVYKTDLSDEDLQIALDTAELVVSEQLTCTMSQERKDKITIYLAAFFADATADSAAGNPGTLRRSKLGEADESYAVAAVPGGGYYANKWGQLAIALDPCNKLSGLGKLPAQFRVY